jgi:hypothetical protein
MFLFYTLMCRNYKEYKRKPCWSQIGTFQKSVPERFSKMVTLRVEDASNGKLPNYKVVGNFTGNVRDIKFNWFQVRTAEINPIHCNPRLGDRNPRSYIKGGNLTRGGLLHPRIAATKSHVFASPMDPISMGRAPKKPGRKGAKARRSPMKPAVGKELPASLPAPPPPCTSCCPPSSSSLPSPSPTPPCIQWFILPHTSVLSYVNMVFDAISYNPVIYAMFV